ncbi:MAG: PH domain-containing protein [Pirellulaceae bacterium]|nr:PH domain-containing protein [Pirellulaceae bacterium]
MSDDANDRTGYEPPQGNQSDASKRDRTSETAGGPSPGDRLRQAAEDRQSDASEQEEKLWQGTFSSRAMIGKWILAAAWTLIAPIAILGTGIGGQATWWAYLLIAVGLWVTFALQLAYRKLAVKYHLTSQRFIHESGLLKRTTDRIEVIDIDDVAVEQGIIERMLGVGTIKIVSSDRTHPELWMRGIDDVKRVATLLDDVRRKERRKRSLHIEAI